MYTWNRNDPCFDWKRPCFGGLKPKNRGQTCSGYSYMCPFVGAFAKVEFRSGVKALFFFNQVHQRWKYPFQDDLSVRKKKKKKKHPSNMILI